MSDFWSLMKNEDNYTYTENGAVAYKSSLNKCLDMFATFGSLRKVDDWSTYTQMFLDAVAEDPVTAMKVLFYVRDIRGGQGARAIFRECMKALVNTHTDYLKAVIGLIPEYGRWDDLFGLIKFRNREVNEIILDFIAKTLVGDLSGESNTLLAKWMPSETASNVEQKKLAAYFANRLFQGDKKVYRQVMSKLRQKINVVESSMSANKWNIDFSKVPSRASLKYKDAFYNHNPEGYTKYLYDVATGKAKINAAALFPVDIVEKAWTTSTNDRRNVIALDAMWKALPNYLEGKEETGLCVVDVSGSMSGTPLNVALSLGLYCAERAKGPYNGKFITFSERPQMIEVRGNNLIEKLHNMNRAHWDMNTNIEAVFDLILDTAIRNKLPQSDIPNKLYIISDMQFDAARNGNDYYYGYNRRRKPSANERTFMTTIKEKFARAGYDMPLLVYWNVRPSKAGMFQETVGGEQCCMVSGFSPSLFKAVIEGTSYEEQVITTATGEKKTVTVQKLNPLDMMMKTLSNPRYDAVGEAMKAFSA